jgi:hypothetical protein
MRPGAAEHPLAEHLGRPTLARAPQMTARRMTEPVVSVPTPAARHETFPEIPKNLENSIVRSATIEIS